MPAPLCRARPCVLLLLCVAVAAAAGAQPPRMNILFLMADQTRMDAVGAYGRLGTATPNLDQLAKQGARLLHAYSATPTCTPARSAILTGMTPWKHGMLGYGEVAPRYAYEMPATLTTHGYASASIGKDHFGWNATTNAGISHGFERTFIYDGLGSGLPKDNDTEGFDNYDAWFQTQLPGRDPLATGLDWNAWQGRPYVYAQSLHPTEWVGRTAVQYILNYSDPRPFFLKVSFHRPHSPYDPPAAVLNATKNLPLPPVTVGDGWDDDYRHGKGCMGADAWCGQMPVADVTNTRQCYRASLALVDEWVGKVLNALEQRGLRDNTFVLFVSDHGDMQSDHYLWRKGFAYESSAHVPMLLWWPDSLANVTVPRGTALAPVAELRDIFPTFLSVAGVVDYQGAPDPALQPAERAAIARLDGKPLTCLLHDPSGQACGWRSFVDLEHDIVFNTTVHWNALTDGHQKYIFHAFFPREQLFDLDKDPGETHDVSADAAYQADLVRWRQRLAGQFAAEMRGPQWVKEGVLQQRVQGQLYSPNYPGPQAPGA